MTDTSPKAVERLIADCQLAAKTLHETDTFATGQSIYISCAETLAALSAQLEDAIRLAATAYGDMQAANKRHATALEAVARARDDALVEAAAELQQVADNCEMRGGSHADMRGYERSARVVLALRTQAPTCDTKSAENATQIGLCAGNVPQAASVEPVTVQEAARVLLDSGDAVRTITRSIQNQYRGKVLISSSGISDGLIAIAGGEA